MQLKEKFNFPRREDSQKLGFHSREVVIFEVLLFSFFMPIFHSYGASADPKKHDLGSFWGHKMALKMVLELDAKKVTIT